MYIVITFYFYPGTYTVTRTEDKDLAIRFYNSKKEMLKKHENDVREVILAVETDESFHPVKDLLVHQSQALIDSNQLQLDL